MDAMPMNAASITWPALTSDIIFIEPEHPGAGRYVPEPHAPKLPENFWTEEVSDADPLALQHHGAPAGFGSIVSPTGVSAAGSAGNPARNGD
jgi:hypothetical protein